MLMVSDMRRGRILFISTVLLAMASCTGPYGRGWGTATELHKAAYRGDAEGVRSALVAGVDPNKPTNIPYHDFAAGEMTALETPLMLAMREGHADVVRELLNAGATPDPAVAPWAVSHGEVFVQLMLDAGFTPNTPIDIWPLNGGTILHWAVRDRQLAIMRQLLDAGADPNARTWDGRTPLAILNWWNVENRLSTASKGVEERAAIVTILLDAGADPLVTFTEFKSGKPVEVTPVSQARNAGYEEIAVMMERAASIAPRR